MPSRKLRSQVHLVGVIDSSGESRDLLSALDRVRYLDIRPDGVLPDEAQDVEVLLIWDFRSSFLRDNWRRLRGLRWIHAAAAGVDSVLIPELVASNVVVTNSRGIFDRAMAEYTIGLMLTLAKDFPTTWRRQQERAWSYRETETLFDKTLVIIGVGPIGREVGRLARAFGMHVHGVGRTARPDDPDFGTIASSDRLSSLLPEADYIVVVAPKTAATDGLIDAPMLSSLKRSARLVNVGRGATVDQQALGRALAEGRIAGAALDVFDTEPLPADDPLWSLSNAVLSPHMAGDYIGWRKDIVALFTANLQHWLQGEALINVVDKTFGYVPSSSHQGG